MNERIKTILLTLAVLVLVGGSVWWWYDTMELHWYSQRTLSDAERENRMLAATRLLGQSGHAVTVAGSLGEMALQDLPDGTLVVGDASGVLAPDKAKQLLAWVKRGNTLVAQPRWVNPAEAALLAKQATPAPQADQADESADEEDDESDSEDSEDSAQGDETSDEPDFDFPIFSAQTSLVEVDPLAAYLGVRLQLDPQRSGCAVAAPKGPAGEPAAAPCANRTEGNKFPLSRLTLPGAPYALELGPNRAMLVSLPRAATPAWSDEQGLPLRVYREGRGRIVMVAVDYFDNSRLRRHDHGELLLALAGLQGGKRVTLVKNFDAPRWHKALWDHYSEALIALAASLALLLWAAVPRFGPVLPEPDPVRRSLIEHIDASGAWLWNADGGRALLLEAARADTLALIQRRAPALLRLPLQKRCAALALACGLPEPEVDEALHQDGSRQQHHFTRQIRTLQKMRNHYER